MTNWDKIKAERKEGKDIKELAIKYDYSYSYMSRKLSDVKPNENGDNRDRNTKGQFVKSNSSSLGKGRPKNTKSIPDLLRKIGNEKTRNDITKLEIILRKVYREARKGKSWAINFIADRTEGKPKETIEQIDTDQIQEIKMI